MTNTEKVQRVQERRRSSAATAVPSRKVRRQGSRSSRKAAAVKAGW